MPPSEGPSVVELRLTELRTELTSVTDAQMRIDEAIANLQRQAESDPAFEEDAEYIDRMTVEAGRKRILQRRREEIDAEIARLGAPKGA